MPVHNQARIAFDLSSVPLWKGPLRPATLGDDAVELEYILPRDFSHQTLSKMR
jgi:hypothetical protein